MCAPCGWPGWTVIQSGPVSQRMPQARRLTAIASSRSLSLTRTLPTPVIVTGPSANGAMAASVGIVSEMSRMTNSPPDSRPVPVTVIVSSVACTCAPIAGRICVPKARSPWADRRPRPGTVTVLPVSAAAARKYEAVDASGSMVRSAAW